MMKRFVALVACVLLVCFCAVAMAESFTATAAGFGGNVSVTLTIDGENLTDVKIEGAGETPGIGGAAIEKLAAKMMEGNCVDVDAMAGATITSNAILNAAAEALAASGATLAAKDVAAAAAVYEEETADVLVIGGGGAGLAASIAAAEAGAEVILVEKFPMLGGNTAMSGGIIAYSATEGDPEGMMGVDEFYDFLFGLCSQKSNPEVVRTYAEKSPETVKWILTQGITETVPYNVGTETVMAMAVTNGATEFINGMTATAKELGVDIRVEHTAKELIMENGAVVGAKVTHADGGEQVFRAKAVVLTTGGFPASPELLNKYSTANAGLITSFCHSGATGDGLMMASAIGADVQFADGWDTCGSFGPFEGMPYGSECTRVMPNYFSAILVNDFGARFTNEEAQRPWMYTEMRDQIANGAKAFYWLLDQNNMKSPEDMDALIEAGWAFKADTIEELAEAIGIDAAALTATVNNYNANAGKEDPEFGKRADCMVALEQAPFYALKNEPIRTTTVGGLVINKDAQILNTAGEVIPGLYAAGEVANYSFFYDRYACGGTAVGHALTFGRIAGANAAANLK